MLCDKPIRTSCWVTALVEPAMLEIRYIVFPGFGIMTFGAMSVFEAANAALVRPHYDVQLLSEAGGPVRSSIGVVVETAAFANSDFDTLIIGGGGEMPFTPGLRDFLQRATGSARRVAATCTGVFFLADAGVVDGRRVTTHWFFAEELRARYPKLRVDESRLFVVDGHIWTSAGMAAGIDQALAMVEADLGGDVARTAAKNMVVHHRRAGGLPQSSVMLELEPKSDRIQQALAYAGRNLSANLTVEQLATAANVGPRQFSRLFRAETGQTPAKAIERLRVEAARMLVQDGTHPIEIVARKIGFRDREQMRLAFIRTFGQPPQAVRRDGRRRRSEG
jgi:transcriptional regulator GlxA family with amidase domain